MYATCLFLAITNYFVLIHRHVEKFMTYVCAPDSVILIIFYLVFFLDGVIFIFFTNSHLYWPQLNSF